MGGRARDLIAACAGALLALALVVSSSDRGMENLAFHMGWYDREAMNDELSATVKEFDRQYVALFTSGGDLSYLNTIPAENLVKRRIVQDINKWSSQDRILSHDRHAFVVKSVEAIRPDRGVVTTEEEWALLMRDRTTGKRMKGQKVNRIRTRYILQRTPGGSYTAGSTKPSGGWKVAEFEVYGPSEELPPLAEYWRER